jgi:hypothetical protein
LNCRPGISDKNELKKRAVVLWENIAAQENIDGAPAYGGDKE